MDPTPKRQRLTGSFSPASPPYHEAAKTSDQTKPLVQPNTPTSPPYLSMNSQADGRPAMHATAPNPEMTPPSSVHTLQQNTQPASSAPNPHPFHTPGSTTGVASSNLDSDGDAMMVDDGDNAEHSGQHRHSNHNRQGRGVAPGKGAASDIAGGPLFSLCQSTHPVSRPHGSQNLFELYGLNGLAKSVARTDPKTGEKINKLRKSYEGHIKALQIAGKPKATKMEGVFTEPMRVPDYEWQEQWVRSKEYGTAMDTKTFELTSNFDDLLNSALSGMAQGPLPPSETAKFRAYLGTDEASKPKGGPEGAANRPIQPTTTPAPGNPASGPRVSRPERMGSKRSYAEHSFSGYGEGYADDFGGNSTGEDDGQGGITKKRRLGGFERTSHQVEVGGARR